MEELISVVVPVYGTQQYLPCCVDSILCQTYSNIEVLLIDDGSTDGSGELCDAYARKDPRVRSVHQQNGGLSAARNTGIRLAEGAYIAFVDSDDIIAPDFLKVLYDAANMYGCEISQCAFVRFLDQIPETSYKAQIVCYSGREMCANLYNSLYVPAVVAWNKLYRRELFQEILFPVGMLHEDEGTTYRLFYKANKVVLTNAPLYYYRRNAGGITGSGYRLKRMDAVQLCRERMEFFKAHKEKELYIKSMLRYWATLTQHWALCKKYLPGEKQALKGLYRQMWQVYPRLFLYAPLRRKLRYAGGLLYPKHYLNSLEQEAEGGSYEP